MYFWRIEKLKSQMVARPLTNREALPYLIVFVGLSSVAGFLPAVEANFWDQLSTGLSVLLAILGTVWLYRRNGGAGGQHFLQRYLAVGWVVAIRMLAVILFIMVLYFIAMVLLGVELVTTTWYEFTFFAIAELLLYWRMGHHLADIAKTSAAV